MTDRLDRLTGEVNDLKVNQATITEKVENLSGVVSSHLETFKKTAEKDDKRYIEQQTLLVKLSENTESVAKNINEFIPECKTKFSKIDEVSAAQKFQNWLLKSMVSVVIIGALGSLVGGIATCNLIPRNPEQEDKKVNFHNIKTIDLEMRRQSMNSTEADRNKFD